MRWGARIVPLLLGGLAGCGVPERPLSIPEKYGLIVSTTNRNLVEQAVVMTDLILSIDQPLRFEITWPASGMYPALRFEQRVSHALNVITVPTQFGPSFNFQHALVVPVYLVDGSSLGPEENTFVPEGERCVVVNADAIEPMMEKFWIGKDGVQRHPSYDKACALALMLLHEMGHLVDGDENSYATSSPLSQRDVVPSPEDVSNPEVKADLYAVRQLDARLTYDRTSHDVLTKATAEYANRVYYIINVAVATVDYRFDPFGILSTKPNLKIYQTAGYSHVNLNLRLLYMQYQLDPTQAKRRVLERIAADNENRH